MSVCLWFFNEVIVMLVGMECCLSRWPDVHFVSFSLDFVAVMMVGLLVFAKWHAVLC